MTTLLVSAALLLATTAHAAPPHGSADESQSDCQAVVRSLLGEFPGGISLLRVGVEDRHARGRYFMYRLYASRDAEAGYNPSVTCEHAVERTDASGAVVWLPNVRRVWVEHDGAAILAPTHDGWWVAPVGSTLPPEAPPVVPPTPVCP